MNHQADVPQIEFGSTIRSVRIATVSYKPMTRHQGALRCDGMTVDDRTMGVTEWTLLIILSIVWGGSFFFAEVALRDLQPLPLVFCRVGLAAAALHVIVLGSGRRMPTERRVWQRFLTMGLLNNLIPFMLIVWGQTNITGGLAAILNATTPIFTVLIAHFVTDDEKMTPNRVAGVVVGFVGAAVVCGPSAWQRLGDEALAQFAVLGAAASYACAGVYGRRLRGESPLVVATGQLTATTAMMVPLAAAFPPDVIAVRATTWAAVFGLALISTAAAYIIYFRLLATAGATNALLVTFLIPVSATLLGGAFLGERIDSSDLAGMAIILAGLSAIDGRAVRWLRRTRVAARPERPA